jgi:hypothetical protein
MVAFTPRFTGDAEPKLDTITPKVAPVHAVALALRNAAQDLRYARPRSVDVGELGRLLDAMLSTLLQGGGAVNIVNGLAQESSSIENALEGYFSGESMNLGQLVARLAALRANLEVIRPLLEPQSAEPAA